VTAAGGAGWQLAEWIVEGESSTIDMLGVDPRRFGPYASRGYLQDQKNEEAYRKRLHARTIRTRNAWDARPLKQLAVL
jgi:dimethylglycine dehydrogenase